MVRAESRDTVKAEVRDERLRLHCFLLDVDEVADEWPEAHQRKRRIVELRKAHRLLAEEPAFQRILDRMTSRY